jgi:hypothetical protein
MRPASTKPRFGWTVALMVGLLVPVLAAGFAVGIPLSDSLERSMEHDTAVTLSYVVMAAIWLLGLGLMTFLARLVWRGPRFWHFAIPVLGGWPLSAGLGLVLANVIDRAIVGDAGFLPLIVAIVIWLGGIVGSVLLGRAVARVGR